MTEKDRSLKTKATDIKGKLYVQVHHRIKFFNENYPTGCIRTELLKDDGKMVMFKAIVTPDISAPDLYFVGHAEESRDDGYINKSSCVENCETSAIGRALGAFNIGVIDGLATADEVNNAIKQQEQAPKQQYKPSGNYDASADERPISDAQWGRLIAIAKAGGYEYDEMKAELKSKGFASKNEIQRLSYDFIVSWFEAPKAGDE